MSQGKWEEKRGGLLCTKQELLTLELSCDYGIIDAVEAWMETKYPIVVSVIDGSKLG